MEGLLDKPHPNLLLIKEKEIQPPSPFSRRGLG
jgi:hypothetical protein